MKFLSIGNPFTRKSQDQRRGDAAAARHIDTAASADDQILSIQHANSHDELSLTPPLPHSHRHPSTTTRSNSTPPSTTLTMDQQTIATAASRKSMSEQTTRKSILLRSPTSRTSLKQSSPQTPPVSSDPSEGALNIDSSNSNSINTSTAVELPPLAHRKRRKSFKEIFSLSSTLSNRSATATAVSHDDQSSGAIPTSSSISSTQKAKRRFSIASSPSTSSQSNTSNSPTTSSPPRHLGIRKSMSSTSFRDATLHSHYSQYANIPPVTAIPAHLSPVSIISPVYPPSSTSSNNKRNSTLPQTPTSSVHNASIPGSAQSTLSSSTRSSHNNATLSTSKSLSNITRSSSVPALYTSAALGASPSSSTGTLATPQSVDLRDNSTSRHGDVSSNMKKQQLSPLLLGPCLSETFLDATSLHGNDEDMTEVFAARSRDNEERGRDRVKGGHESDDGDGYGSESAEGRVSMESDDYGAASNMSHGMQDEETEDRTHHSRKSRLQEHSDQMEVLNAANSNRRPAAASAGNTLRVDTSLASASASSTSASTSPSAIQRTSAYTSTSPASLSPHSHSFPSSGMYRSQDNQARSASPASTYRRTPTPTLRAVDALRTPSPRALSQGAKICLDYTTYRLRRDGSASSSTQAEKVNILSSGGRGYPSSTRPLVITHSSTLVARHSSEQTSLLHQLRKEPKNASMAKELAYITLMKKLHSRKRLTLMEEVELDGFKRIQSSWTPCSSPSLQVNFTLSPPHSDASKNANANASEVTASPLKNAPLRTSSSDANSSSSSSTSTTPKTATIANEDSKINTSTSAFVSGAFMTAQQMAWQKWVNRMSFQESKVCILQDGEKVPLSVQSNKVKRTSKILLSNRAKAWAHALPLEVESNRGPGGISLPDSFELSPPSPLLSGQEAKISSSAGLIALSPSAALKDKPHPNLPVSTSDATHLQASNDTPPFMKNRISMFGRRTPSSNSEDQAGGASAAPSRPSTEKARDASDVDVKKNGGSKNSFGSALASKLGFRSGKNKVPAVTAPVADVSQYVTVVPTKEARNRQEEGSSASSSATTSTPKSTPTTSASSACSDQTDVDTTLKPQDFTRLYRAEGSNLRPPREEKQRPSSMVRSATTQSLLSVQQNPTRPSSMFLDGQRRNSEQHPAHRTESVSTLQPRTSMPKSHSEQRLSTYHHYSHEHHVHTASSPSHRRVSLIEDHSGVEKHQRRVRVVSQPAGHLHPRPHSMYSAAHTRERSGTSTASNTRRPASQLLQVPRPASMLIPTPTDANSARYQSRDYDDDELPLAVLRQSATPQGTPPLTTTSRDGAATPEARPRLRSAMRSASQPQPSSMYNASNRHSLVSQQGQPPMPRPHSFANTRLSVYDPPNGSGGNSENHLKSQIRDEQMRKEREEEELRRRREQRKVWEDHRRRSVYLDEKAAAAEKAASEANRRQSQLYMSMTLAQPSFNPSPYSQATSHNIYSSQDPHVRRAG